MLFGSRNPAQTFSHSGEPGERVGLTTPRCSEAGLQVNRSAQKASGLRGSSELGNVAREREGWA